MTELVTGLDLVRAAAAGRRGRAAARRGRSPPLDGHAIEARLYAEDPAARLPPATGTLHRFAVPPARACASTPASRTARSVAPHYDPMLAKVIAVAPTRAEAARRLAAALAGARLHGVTTNRDLLVGVLRHPSSWPGPPTPASSSATRRPSSTADSADAGGRARLGGGGGAGPGRGGRAGATPRAGDRCRSGWRNNPSQPQRGRVRGPGRARSTWPTARPGTGSSWRSTASRWRRRVWSATPEAVDLELDGVRRRFEVHLVDGTADVDSALGGLLPPRAGPPSPVPGPELAAGSLVAPMPGTVVRVAVAARRPPCRRAQVLVVLEAMKMEHAVASPGDGRVAEVRVAVGQVVDTGAILAVVEAVD